MSGVVAAVSDALEPYVGRMVADTCIRATALQLGKTADSLDSADIPALESSIRRLLSSIAPQSAIEDIIVNLEGGLS